MKNCRSSPSVSLVLVSNLREVLQGRGFGIRVSITLVWHCSALITEIYLWCLALVAQCLTKAVPKFHSSVTPTLLDLGHCLCEIDARKIPCLVKYLDILVFYRLPPTTVRMNHERLPRHGLWCATSSMTSRGQIWHILNIAASFSATLFWPNFQ
jgi:hypothetical protein